MAEQERDEAYKLLSGDTLARAYDSVRRDLETAKGHIKALLAAIRVITTDGFPADEVSRRMWMQDAWPKDKAARAFLTERSEEPRIPAKVTTEGA